MQEDRDLKESLKELLRRIKGSADAEAVDRAKKDFKQVLEKATPLMIAQAEQELVGEGFTRDDLVSACDVHLELFRESLQEDSDLPPDHPVSRFRKDHRIILGLMERLRDDLRAVRRLGSFEAASEEIGAAEALVDRLLDAENHNVRQENTLFPLLERHGLEQPPAIMWMEHTEMKEDKKRLKRFFGQIGKADFDTLIDAMDLVTLRLLEKFAAHTMKEKNILYHAALEVLTEEEWKDVREECDSLGYLSEEENQ